MAAGMTAVAPRVALVTGATGFVGRHVATRLVDAGWAVRLLVRDRNRLSTTLTTRCGIVTGGLGQPETLCQAVRDVDVIFHCAANVNTWDSHANYTATNVRGVENLLNATLAAAPNLGRFVHLSTVDVYGFPVAACNEESPTSGHGFGYGETKLQGETLVKQYGATHHLPYTILRPANVIGPGSQFISRIGDELRSGLMLTIDGGHSNAGFIDIETLVDYILWAALAPQAVGQCYNVRDDYDVSWALFLDSFSAGIKGRGRIINLPFILADTMATSLELIHRSFWPSSEPFLHRLLVRLFGRTCGHSAAKIRADSKLSTTTGYEATIDRSIAWYLAQRGT